MMSRTEAFRHWLRDLLADEPSHSTEQQPCAVPPPSVEGRQDTRANDRPAQLRG